MKKEKTNIDYLRDLINEMKYIDAEKGAEALEFLEAIEEDQSSYNEDDLRDEIASLEEKNRELESEIENLKENPETEEYYVGLDTLFIGYQYGNLKIQQQVESFIERLQSENAVVPA